MINSDRELEIVKEDIKYLRGCRDRVFQRPGDPFMMHLSAASFEKKMRQLWEEIDEYENRTGKRARSEEEAFLAAPQPGTPESAPVDPVNAVDPR